MLIAIITESVGVPGEQGLPRMPTMASVSALVQHEYAYITFTFRFFTFSNKLHCTMLTYAGTVG